MRIDALIAFSTLVVAIAIATNGDAETNTDAIIARAREEVSRNVSYDPAYRALTFKNGIDTQQPQRAFGDVEPSHGVCTDVVVRALRVVGIDLQSRVHADITASPRSYPDVPSPDANIDHRRVKPLLEYFDRHATKLDSNPQSATWKPADVVIWSFSQCPHCEPNHIGMISDRKGARGLPLVIHNIGPHPTEDDVLDQFVILRHFRIIDSLH
jgi:uncharacterized protein YijF (DUF1287 family)